MRKQGLILKRSRQYYTTTIETLITLLQWIVVSGLILLSLLTVQGCTQVPQSQTKLTNYCTTIAKPTIRTNKDLDSWAWLLEEHSKLCGIKILTTN